MATLINSPFPVFTDTDGLPLENGYINIGVAGLNPLSNPRQAYWDEALTMPASLIRTTRGYPARNGAAAFLYAAPGDFSILIRNKNGVVIFSNLNVIDQVTVLQNISLGKADLDSPVFIGTPTAPTAALSTVTTQLATTAFVIQNSHVLGEQVLSEFEELPSVSFPAVPRNANQDISSANWPLLVDKLRLQSAKVLGVTDHAVNVAGSDITFPVAASTTALLSLLVEDAVVSNYLNGGEIANFTGGATYAVAALRKSINIANVDYAITGINTATRVVTVAAAPAAGAQTAICYTYRIDGSATTARLLRIAGFVGVAAGDAGGEVVGGFRKMDRGQGHKHGSFDRSIYAGGGSNTASCPDTVGSLNTASSTVQTPISDTVNGTPRTGKTTDPRTAGQYAYTWGGIYVAP